jgi:hypothetical protein
MNFKRYVSGSFLVATLVCSVAADDPNGVAEWSTAGVELRAAVSNAVCVAVAVSTNRTVTPQGGGAHISTSMSMGDGTVIHGGGYVHYAICRQSFQLLEVLHGRKPDENFILEYGFLERSDAFPGPREECPIPIGQKVVLVLGETNKLLKALPDTPDNRTKIKELHKQHLLAPR